MSSVSAKTPLQVGVTVETMTPPGEKSLTHSYQRRDASLSDRNRTIGEFLFAFLRVCMCFALL